MKVQAIARCLLVSLVGCLWMAGCKCSNPAHDRPFPLGQVTDAFWETQQTNAEASDFIFYDHEFVGDTAKLTPYAEKHIQQVALRFTHVPFPIVIEESPNRRNPQLDAERRQAVIGRLRQLGLDRQGEHRLDARVVVAPALAEGISGIEGERNYQQILGGWDNYGGGGGRGYNNNGYGNGNGYGGEGSGGGMGGGYGHTDWSATRQ